MLRAVIALLTILTLQGAAAASQRRAFVIDIAEYRELQGIVRPVGDARAVPDRLSQLGFTSELVLNVDGPTLQEVGTVTCVPTSTTRPVGIWKKSVASPSRPTALTALLNGTERHFLQCSAGRRGDGHVDVPALLIWGAQDASLGREQVQPTYAGPGAWNSSRGHTLADA
jgi:hypothetical protein